MYLVSVIIPTFNRCTLLKRALATVYKQSYSHFEIIVVDDGSTDGTAEMIKTFFPDLTYHFQENTGVSASRNQGLTLAKGDWIAFLDSDDEWLPDKLQNQLAAFQSEPEYKICHTEEIWVRHGTRVNQMKKHQKAGGWIFPQCLPLCAMSPSSILIHRSVFHEIGTFNTSMPACEDYDLWLRITAKYPVLFIEQPQIIKYGGHADQLSQKYWGMDRFRILALQDIIMGNTLNESYRHMAVAMLIKKCKVFQKGAAKRGKHDDVQHYQSVINQFSVTQ